MAKRKTDSLYLGAAPEEDYNPFAIPLGPSAQRATGRKTTAKQKGDKPRDLGVRIKPRASISAPKKGYARRAEEAVSRAVPTLEPVVQGIESFLGPAELEDALTRGVTSLFDRNAYAGTEGLRSEDAALLGITGLAGPAFNVAGKGLRKAMGVVPQAAREGISDFAARAGRYLRETPGAPLRDADFVEGVFNELPEGMSFAARPQQGRIGTTYRQPQALPAAEERLGLPAPGPGLPEFAAKPRGGQFYPDMPLGPMDAQAAGYKLDNYTGRQGEDVYQVLSPSGNPINSYRASTPEGAWKLADAHFDQNRGASNLSPEAAARAAALEALPFDETTSAWLEKALAKYYKTDFGSPNDPLRSLAERGLHYDPEMTPERWLEEVNSSLMEDPIGYFTVPRHESSIRAEYAAAPDDLAGQLQGLTFFGAGDPIGQGALMQAAPWLRKQPVTDMLYGIRDPLDLGHFGDEFANALRAEEAGLPADLAVRPEMLERMSFPQAVERVGRINQFRAKEMERAALNNLNSPAVQVFKEYTDDNPMGLRWVELRAPEMADLPPGYDIQETAIRRAGAGDEETPFYRIFAPDGETVVGEGYTPEIAREEALRYAGRDPLQQALRYEGDTMGHCVGGYCDDVLGGKSRIFSLRDAKGEPHVTIETTPGAKRNALADIPREALDEITAAAKADTDQVAGPMGIAPDDPRWVRTYQTNLGLKQREWLQNNPLPDDIVQIKGKQNRAPKDDYLPFVQDFVKSQQWGNIGDFGNTGLVRLPDGRYITQQQLAEGVSKKFNVGPGEVNTEQPRYYEGLMRDNWEAYAPYFEGYAVGGRVEADRCFCRHPMAVPGKKAPNMKVKK